jgi:dTDP-glucose 4,6-dehydratase
MRCLITGGAGFIGSHLCDALLAESHEVVAVDNLLTGREANVAHLKNDPRFQLVQADINDPFDVGRVAYVFHFASPASPVDYMEHGIATLKVGSYGTFHALEIARRYGAKFLLASTSECYGDPLVHPQPETYWGNVNPIGPRSVYDESKRFSEAATMAYHRYHKVDTHIVRIFNTYGPRMQINDGRVIPNFMKQALRGEPLTIYGNGQQTRSFCYVADEVAGILALARSDEHLPTNIGNPREFTMLEAAQKVLEVVDSLSALGSRPSASDEAVSVESRKPTTDSSSKDQRLRFEPLPEDDPKQRRPDITKARKLLNWEPEIELEAGLRLSFDYFRQAVKALASTEAAR